MPGSGIDIPLWEVTGKMETSTSCSIRSSAGEKPGIFTPHLPGRPGPLVMFFMYKLGHETTKHDQQTVSA